MLFVCLYTAVLPNRVDHARPLAMSVRRDVWDTYQQRWASPLSILFFSSFFIRSIFFVVSFHPYLFLTSLLSYVLPSLLFFFSLSFFCSLLNHKNVISNIKGGCSSSPTLVYMCYCVVYYRVCIGMVEDRWFRNWRSAPCVKLFLTATPSNGNERKKKFIEYVPN